MEGQTHTCSLYAGSQCTVFHMECDCNGLSQPYARSPFKTPFVFFLLGVSIIYTEVLARLHFFMLSYPALIGKLCLQCLSWFNICPHPILIPLCGFLPPPGGPLKMTLSGFLKGKAFVQAASRFFTKSR